MNNLTAVVITKNAQNLIKECLESIKFADEIIILDCFSEDLTTDIAKNMGAKVVKVKFEDFSQLRNQALKHVKTKWLLYIDSDERVSTELKDNIIKIKDTDIGAVSFNRKNYYLGKPWPYKETLTRLFQKEFLTGWIGEIHESPKYKGEVKKIDGDLIHYTHRTIEEMFVKTISWSEVEANTRYVLNHPKIAWWRLIRVYLTGFYDSYIKKQGFRVGQIGLIESLYQGFSMFITYLRLWELQQNPKK